MFHQLANWSFIIAFALDQVKAGPVIKRSLDTNAILQQHYGNDAEWYSNRIPFFDSSDEKLNEIYYYRWQIFRAHQRDLGNDYGFITTEFADDVSWQLSPWASLNDATGFHLNEGRWCRDRRFTHDYINHMFGERKGNDRHFSDYMADSVWNVYLVDHDSQAATQYLDQIKTVYDQWNDHFDMSKGLYYIEPIADATEFTISSIDASGGTGGFTGGTSFRPSINSYMYANFKAIAQLARLTSDENSAETYERRANILKNQTQTNLWNSTFEHFIDRFQVNNDYVKYFDFIRGRELVGYVPFMFDLPDDTSVYAASWSHVLDANLLGGQYGMRTNEPSYEHYMQQYRYDVVNSSRPECQWNGPVWPFQTTQVLLGMSNVLDHYNNKGDLNISQFNRLLSQYVDLHYDSNGKPNLEEDYNPDKGGAIVGLDRSPHYFHSGFVDIVLGGLVGIRPRSDDKLEINPLVDQNSGPSWFRAEEVPYHGSNIAVQYDRDGSHYGTKGLVIERDGQQVAASATLQRIIVDYAPKDLLPIDRPSAISIQLQESSAYPRGSASSNANDTTKIHDAIDGRVWFTSELANGWESDTNANQWYAIELGNSDGSAASNRTISRAEIAWFADDNTFAAPDSYTIETSTSNQGPWTAIPNVQQIKPLANGITHAQWTSLDTSNVRLSFTLPSGKRARLTEFKLF
ncbi:glycogen debranching enzyme [Meira miltonrushii]|uniref:Glycogen debranching enzyme n=1 Tax=Meira miltonrushii TaxID=1280837 RepID=A0A316VGS5_9BASI|nr:glycogen debranching enzyme [Meira miltonrushii]PWN36792.1 glycogen debranching enzyme [Meira miltonrushii]